MKYALVILMLFFSGRVFADNLAQDSTTKAATDSTTNKKMKDTTNKKTDTTAQKASTALLKTLKAQQEHTKKLYENKAASPRWGLIIGFLLVAGPGLWLLFRTPLCRDLSYDPQTSALRPEKERPFSYAKVQLLWWTSIILSCFLAFYIYTGILPAFTSTIAILLGGGLAVALFGKVIDNSQTEANKDAVPVRHQDVGPAKGLLIDILSDDGGISIHRFQSIVFTIIFGIAFVVAFIKNIHNELFPFLDFEDWQLTLMGISASAYLGFKMNENNAGTKTGREVEAVKNSKGNTTTRGITNESKAGQESAAFLEMKEDLERKGLV
ncbi:hypothetical protein [Chitinophaga tropicalis]|uniref:Uncharacterized protein n=1 Tax=Chitinophaga tropicalis TaxID=2683588 RepID=A0A7K1UAJ4_9BACT|nr:hypothetical protein [Chitinophaga tropicalis]MVT11300.1 hypothetical protein [Chitinophaga tropicalis]